MQRSIKLGHCICNPKQPCPCPMFTEQDVCMCAGERPKDSGAPVRLTKMVENAGCASKISQADLKKVLSGLPEVTHPDLLVGTSTCDDAGVYRIGPDRALVQTVDVFTPNVDDPYTFGQIAAANSVSDVYAMGGTPLTALSIIAFPIEKLPHRVMTEIIRGGMDKLKEAGVIVIGGHSLKDAGEVKFGFAVTGMVNPKKMVQNSTAQPGDVLVLTKPLGAGIISFAHQIGKAPDAALKVVTASMAELNKTAAELMVKYGAHAGTDVTGFGLLGHLSEMVGQSGVTAELWAEAIPVFDGARECAAKGIVSGGIERNIEHSARFVTFAPDVPEDMRHVLFDPQTSGGMLVSLPAGRADKFVAALHAKGVGHAAVIGTLISSSKGAIMVKTRKAGKAKPKMAKTTAASCCCSTEDTSCCCGTGEGIGTNMPDLGSVADVQNKFMAFTSASLSAGALPRKTKELIAIALSLLSKCGHCVKIHVDVARSVGASDAEIAEALWVAIAFGGAPALMFYETIRLDMGM